MKPKSSAGARTPGQQQWARFKKMMRRYERARVRIDKLLYAEWIGGEVRADLLASLLIDHLNAYYDNLCPDDELLYRLDRLRVMPRLQLECWEPEGEAS